MIISRAPSHPQPVLHREEKGPAVGKRGAGASRLVMIMFANSRGGRGLQEPDDRGVGKDEDYARVGLIWVGSGARQGFALTSTLIRKGLSPGPSG